MSDDANRDTRQNRRQPYEPPRIEETGSFERLVLACGHTPVGQPGGGGACDPAKGGSTNS